MVDFMPAIIGSILLSIACSMNLLLNGRNTGLSRMLEGILKFDSANFHH